MAYQINWTTTAEYDFDEILEVITNTQNNNAGVEFIQIFYKKLDILAEMPFVGVQSQIYEGIRRILITKRYSLLYQIEKEIVILIRIIDNRSAFQF